MSAADTVFDLPPALDGAQRLRLDGPAGGLCLYVAPGAAMAAGSALAAAQPPLLLVHSINAAGSAREMRPVFEALAAQRAVYALDLPGFGLSERSDRRYTPALMTAAVQQAAGVVAQRHGGVALDGMALSLGCEYLARAAHQQPGRWRTLALISPTGLGGRRRQDGPPGASRELPWLYRLLAWPGWAQGLYRNLTRPGVIRYFLQKTWGGPQIDEDLWRYDVLIARAPGARFAPLHFLSAGLFSADINALYDTLTQPVWVAHGTRGDFTDYRGLAPLLARSGEGGAARWSAEVFDGGAMPHFEHAPQFLARYGHWLAAWPPGLSSAVLGQTVK